MCMRTHKLPFHMDTKWKVMVDAEHHISNQLLMANTSAELEASEARWVAPRRRVSSEEI